MTTESDVNQGDELQTKNETISAVLLATYLERHFDGSLLDSARHFGVTSQQVKRWLKNKAVVAENAIYLRKSNFPETKSETIAALKALTSNVKDESQDPTCCSLDDHIDSEFSGNQTAFAKANGSTQQQVFRWANLARCLYLCGQVYRHQFTFEPLVKKKN